jgi:hypothetical protein
MEGGTQRRTGYGSSRKFTLAGKTDVLVTRLYAYASSEEIKKRKKEKSQDAMQKHAPSPFSTQIEPASRPNPVLVLVVERDSIHWYECVR